jgi:hypothetical protein
MRHSSAFPPIVQHTATNFKKQTSDGGPSLSGSRTETNEIRARVGCILIGMKK